ncbi:MAG: glycosyltransferase family 2 protein [Candidatus Parcubacteria bacterium]|nr:glycosyltransferase family 2 protein [Burkholderiales bacterium]
MPAPRPGAASAHSPVSLGGSVSVGMAAHGNAQTTRNALQALLASAAGDYELILVDDVSPDDTLDVFREVRNLHRNARIYSFNRNLDYCESVNAFLSHARGDTLIFLSNDIFASPAYLRILTQSAAAHPDCGILRGCSNFVDKGTPAHMVPMAAAGTRESYFEFAQEIARRHEGGSLIDERYLVGDAFLVKRAVIDRIGTFDTRFVGYFGDVDFGLRAQIAGFRVVLERRAFAFHQKHGNIAYLSPEAQQERWQRRRAKVAAAADAFVDKYALQLTEDGIGNLPWDELRRRPFDPALHRVAPRDYSGFLLPG